MHVRFCPFARIEKRCSSEQRHFYSGGFEVFSTSIANRARRKIETGRCGALLMCFRVPPPQAQELASLFRFVVKDTQDLAADADVFIPESKGPQAIVQALRSGLQNQRPESL